jgi:hypothetical protein
MNTPTSPRDPRREAHGAISQPPRLAIPTRQASTTPAAAAARHAHRRARRLLARRFLATTSGARPCLPGRRRGGQAPAHRRAGCRHPGGRALPPRATAHTFTPGAHVDGPRVCADAMPANLTHSDHMSVAVSGNRGIQERP